MSGRMDRLVVVAELMRDQRLSQLTAAIRARDAAVALREGLVALPGSDGAALRAQALYGVWVERRRAALAVEIAERTRAVEAELAEARRLFARAEVVRKLRDQLS